ncbi:hypothetical protein Tco_1247419 [Tanacetum coccineum]
MLSSFSFKSDKESQNVKILHLQNRAHQSLEGSHILDQSRVLDPRLGVEILQMFNRKVHPESVRVPPESNNHLNEVHKISNQDEMFSEYITYILLVMLKRNNELYIIRKRAHQEALKKEIERLRKVYQEQNMQKADEQQPQRQQQQRRHDHR